MSPPAAPAPTNPPNAGTPQLLAWAGYDWANSAFSAVIQTFVFAAYFTKQIAADPDEGQTQWALAIGLAGVVVALTGPFLGAIADQGGRRKPWIGLLTALCIVSTACLWLVDPSAPVWFALYYVALGTVGIEGAAIFYNAMLADLASGKRLGRWSGWGWAAGYIGGLACLLLALAFIIGVGERSAARLNDALDLRYTFLLVAGWFALFSLPFFLVTPDRPSTRLPLGRAAVDGVRQLIDSAKHVRRYGHIVRFLVARLCYVDGLASIFALGGVYAAGVFDMDATDILMFGIGMNLAAGAGAFGLGWVDDRIGGKWTVVLAIIGVLIPGLALLLIQDVLWFWVAGLTLGVFVGPVQSSSRSYLARVAPPELRTQCFGLYALSGKATAFAGPLLVFAVTAATGNQRAGMIPIFCFLTLGLLLMLTVPSEDKVAPTEPDQ